MARHNRSDQHTQSFSFDEEPDATPVHAEAPVQLSIGKIVKPIAPFELTDSQKSALDLVANRVISASAGTGKTFTLTALYLGLLEGRLSPGGKLLSEQEWLQKADAGELSFMRPNQIVAVTFTEKAAAELLARARAALVQEANRTDLPANLQAHLIQCMKELSGAPVSTIHAFCARLLREAGAQGPLPAAFNMLEQEDADGLLHEALGAAAAEMLQSDAHPYFTKLAAEWNVHANRVGLVAVGRKLLNVLRARGLSPDALKTQTIFSLKQIQQMLSDIYASVVRVPDKGRSKPSAETREFCAQHSMPNDLEEARILALKLRPLLLTKSGQIPKWAEEYNIVDPSASILLAAHVPYTAALADFIALALKKYMASKRKAGGVDFDDLLLASKEMIDADVNGNIAERYAFVLIDEYQDTNPLQHQILTGVALPHSNPGTHKDSVRLGVVGDIKQSIYRFRGADVSLMEAAQKNFSRAPLRENFRSRKTVIAFFNAFFSHIWPQGGRFYYDEEHHLNHAGDDARHAWDGPAGELIVWNDEERGNAETHRLQQAFAIARRIRTMLDSGPESALPRPVVWDRAQKTARNNLRCGDFAVLARSLKNLRQPLQLALTHYQIPFQMLGGVNFFTRQEVIDATNLWAAICDPSDNMAVTGLLRSPFAGLSDAGLFWLTERGLSRPKELRGIALTQTLLDVAKHPDQFTPHVSPTDAQALVRAAKMLDTLVNWRGRKTAAELLDWALTESGYLSILALQPRGEVAVAAMRKTIELARAFEAKGNLHLSDFVRWMREHGDEEWDDPNKSGGPDLTADLPENEDAVRIGTIHSAKGLEFPIVFVADLGAPQAPFNDAALFSPGRGVGLRLGAYYHGLRSAADALHLENLHQEKLDEDAERLRLLYVALTRARDYLIFVGETGKNSGSETNWRKLLDNFRTTHPNAITEIQARHPDLKSARPGAASGLLIYQDGQATLREEFKSACAEYTPPPENSHIAVPKELRVSVSKLAHWLWCPRQAAFEQMNERSELNIGRKNAALDFNDAESSAQELNGDLDSPSPDARALGTAAHAALEVLFGAEYTESPETLALAAESFSRALSLERASDDPEVKRTYEHVLALARSEKGRALLSLPASDREVERALRWRLELPDGSALTLIGKLDLLARIDTDRWQIVDYKLAAFPKNDAPSQLVRYAWQAGMYASAVAEIMQVPENAVSPSLAFLRDDNSGPRTIEDLGQGRATQSILKRVSEQFVAASGSENVLDLPSQVWMPSDNSPMPRNEARCRAEGCPFVARCFK